MKSPPQPEMAPSAITVRLSSADPSADSPHSTNPLRLYGAAQLTFDSDVMVLQGLQRRFLLPGRPIEVRLGVSRLTNVRVEAERLRFEESGVSIGWTLYFESATAARSIAERIRATQGRAEPAVEPVAEGAQREFAQRLVALGSRDAVAKSLVALNVMVFLAMIASGASVVTPDAATMVRWGSNFAPYTGGGQSWRLLTSQFLHFGILHLAFNMWALWANGPLVERLFGSGRFLVLYLVAGTAGSVASALWNPLVNSAGASGAIFGVFGGLLAFMLRKDMQVPASVMASHRSSVLLFIAFNLFNGLSHAGIDNAAHLGGLAAGVLLGYSMARPLDRSLREGEPPWSRYGIPIAMFVVAAVLAPVAVTSRGDPAVEQQFHRNMEWFVKVEPPTLRISDELYRAAARQTSGRGLLVLRLDREVCPVWEESARRFAAQPEPNSRVHRLQLAVMRRLAAERLEGDRLFRRWLLTSAPADHQALDASIRRQTAIIAEYPQT